MHTVDNTLLTDYRQLLQQWRLPFQQSGPYLFTANPPASGWVLELGAIRQQLDVFIPEIASFLVREQIPFAIPVDKMAAERIISAQLGYYNVGKLIMVFPSNEAQLLHISAALVSLTDKFRSPDIPGAYLLGGTVYLRFVPVGGIVAQRYFTLPAEIPWPFEEPRPLAAIPAKQLLKQTYELNKVITFNAKGDAFSAVYKDELNRNQSCFIKQGRRHVFTDDSGRDIQDRLQWQYEVHKRLEGMKGIPKVLELFTEERDMYLVMELINGHSLTRELQSNSVGMLDNKVPIEFKLERLDWLLQIIDRIEELHNKGFLHRDISPENFLLTEGGIFLIDLELCWDMNRRYPDPPFNVGTMGFVSPAQQRFEQPEVADDVFALGALLFVFFTSISPVNLKVHQPEQNLEMLNYLLANRNLSKLIASCLNLQPENRPSVEHIKSEMQLYRQWIADGNEVSMPIVLEYRKLDEVMGRGMAAYSGQILCNAEGLWGAKSNQNNVYTGINHTRVVLPGFSDGIAGILFMMANAAKVNALPEAGKVTYYNNLNFVAREYIFQPDKLTGGLYHGAAGVALAIAAGIHAGLIDDPALLKQISVLLEKIPAGIDIVSGAAGHGLAVLACLPYLHKEVAERLLSECRQRIMNDNDFLQARLKQTGFDNGIAGIVYFLWCYAAFDDDSEIKEEAIVGMKWLETRLAIHGEQVAWFTDITGMDINLWHDNGVAGVLRCYLKAWQVTGDISYRELIVSAVASLPALVRTPSFGYNSGCAGLGDVLLQLHQVLGEEDILHRALDVANLLLYTASEVTKAECVWRAYDNEVLTASLLNGHAGCMQFLLRCKFPEMSLMYDVLK